MNYKTPFNFLKKIFYKDTSYKKSYSQCGEDMIIDFIFAALKIKNPVYLDIGANEPKMLNNTYLFYENGHGVLIEPNPLLIDKLKKQRPLDIHLNCGVGFNNKEETADYYEMDWHEFNTFSKEIAYETQEKYKGKNNIKNVIQLKLVGINLILEKYFLKGLDLLSIDVEGLDLEILKSINFKKCIPKVICVETRVGSHKNSSDIADYLISEGYILFSQTPINGIFVHINFFKNSTLEQI
jgi:FkbM family methyltransferase